MVRDVMPPGTGRTQSTVAVLLRRTPVGVGERRSSARVVFAGLGGPCWLLRRRMREGRRPATRPVVSEQPDGDCAKAVSVRPDVAQGLGRIEVAGQAVSVQPSTHTRV